MSSIAAAHPPALRRALALLLLAPRSQCRNAQVVNARFFQSRVEPRVVAKYREKLDQKLKSEGVSSIEELKQVYKDKIDAIRKEASVPEIDAVLEPTPALVQKQHAPFKPPPPPKPIAPPSSITGITRRASEAPPGVKTLASYVDLEKLRLHADPKEIELIWRARFLPDKTSLCAVMPRETYARMEAVARKNPMFLLPMSRKDQGYEMHLLQWTFPTRCSSTVIFTTLADYKLRGEFAQPHTLLTHHLELAEDRDLVLVQGQVLPDRGMEMELAQWLVIALQKFYGAFEGPEAERRRGMLELFTKGDGAFSLDALIEEAKTA